MKLGTLQLSVIEGTNMSKSVIKGYSVYIDHDVVDSPREWGSDNVMYCVHNRYKLGDKQPKIDELQEIVKQAEIDGKKILPLYLIDHSGLSMSVGSFGCLWDSGQVGYIIGDDEESMKNDVAVYDQYLRGDVWIVTVKHPSGETIESLGDIYGLAEAEKEAESIVNNLPKLFAVGEKIEAEFLCYIDVSNFIFTYKGDKFVGKV
jgi:hypothetical protein